MVHVHVHVPMENETNASSPPVQSSPGHRQKQIAITVDSGGAYSLFLVRNYGMIGQQSDQQTGLFLTILLPTHLLYVNTPFPCIHQPLRCIDGLTFKPPPPPSSTPPPPQNPSNALSNMTHPQNTPSSHGIASSLHSQPTTSETHSTAIQPTKQTSQAHPHTSEANNLA
ncbi:uncharacterized protein BO95DRAFT_267831 [Aspergillus brunneoviolaceus CBS 621.78]|uniref:Uncharacterized protein n=1 Tax=Aspergillus brunneoviolaceus CBS 621.78 TaxID=1450534 RepID=A0ACD1FWW9_9EURO|nr:hypothetical protein BO95DRAFT_267831 [Aspergillus brunneoviolaceus CBS 621.78]RAH41449.1 hypothetical protein BO95DRAFT_267831 [Aspergillus brunneoviolaceus CBS 621.78]